MATQQQLADEAIRVPKIRQIVDIASCLIMHSDMTRDAAETLIRGVRERILTLFPGGEQAYELIYGQRFRRLINEFAQPSRRVS